MPVSGAIELITGTTQAPLERPLRRAVLGPRPRERPEQTDATSPAPTSAADLMRPWSEPDGLTLQAAEQNGSGYSGFTTLRPAPDGGTQVSVALAASSAATEAAAAQPEPPPSTTYTSPTFGYTIGYGPTWEEAENVSSNGRDRFVLFNDTSYITFTGAREFGGDPQACVDAFVAQLTADPAREQPRRWPPMKTAIPWRAAQRRPAPTPSTVTTTPSPTASSRTPSSSAASRSSRTRPSSPSSRTSPPRSTTIRSSPARLCCAD